MRVKIAAFIICCSLVLASGAQVLTNGKPSESSSTTSSKDPKISKTVPSTEKPIITTQTIISSQASNNVTTAAPSTTSSPALDSTTAPAVSAPIPTSVPDPQSGRWWASGKNMSVVLRMAAQLNIAFNTTNQQSIKKIINIPSNGNVTKVNGTFDEKNETIIISWKTKNATGESNIIVAFNKYEKLDVYCLGSITIKVDASELPDLNTTLELVHSQEHFNTSLKNSYRCVKLQDFNLTKLGTDQIIGHLKVTDLQFQAFKKDENSSFGLPEDCALDTSDVVPIAVGCVLAGLVVIVLAAYLISRRRSQPRGYLSM